MDCAKAQRVDRRGRGVLGGSGGPQGGLGHWGSEKDSTLFDSRFKTNKSRETRTAKPSDETETKRQDESQIPNIPSVLDYMLCDLGFA